MPTGFLVTIGSDNTLWFGDGLGTAATTFTGTRVGAGSIIASGSSGGETFTGRAIGGAFYTGPNNTLYFEPDAPGLTITSATVGVSPVYNTAVVTGRDTNIITETMNGDPDTPQTFNGLGGPDHIRGGGGAFSNNGSGGATDTDVLNGGAGNDNLEGQGGWDRLIGGAGNDTLNGGYGLDIADYSDGTAGITMTIANGTVNLSGAGLGTDSLEGIDGVIGTAFADSITGFDGDGVDPDGSTYTNYIDGGAGNDTINGLTGSDYLFGGSGDDSIIGGLWDGDAGVTLGAGRVSGEGGTVDDRIFAGIGNDMIYGDDIAGTSSLGGNDYIDASEGNDQIIAGAGNDTVYAGNGDDRAQGDAGDDSIFGGAGQDIIYGDDTVGTSTVGGADYLDGGDGEDAIFGGGGNDTLIGGNGADLLVGGEGNDQLDGGADNDQLDGGAGTDILNGGAGDDILNGGAGNDILNGGLGADTLTGGAGADVFVADSGDTITDFNTGDDPLNRDSIDLSGYYNQANLDAWNAANPTQVFATPLGWLRADAADGILSMAPGSDGQPLNLTLTLTGPNGVDGLVDANTSVMCFAADVLIDTDRGPVAAGDLAAGDMVRTRDAGMQPLRWTGRRVLTAAELAAAPNLRPIRIRAGALGADTPSADLVVSPQHRVLVRSKIAQKMFGTDEVLVAAKQLLLVDGVDVAADLDGVTYVHFLFDDHQVVWSNGAETESLHPGKQALNAVGVAGREEIFALFPELRDGAADREPARVLASGRMGRKLAMRHAQNGKPLVA